MKKTFKRGICAILVLSLALGAAAFAEGSALTLLNAACTLAFDTHNVTLGAEASFTYDGEWFKNVHAEYRQDGSDSYLSWMLDSPDKNGGVYTGGYEVVANGSSVYFNETKKGYYMTTGTQSSDTVLRTNGLTSAYRAVTQGLVDLLGSELDKMIARTETETGAEYAVKVQNPPVLTDAALNYMVMQYLNENFHYLAYEANIGCTPQYENFEAFVGRAYMEKYPDSKGVDALLYRIQYSQASEEDWQRYWEIYDVAYDVQNEALSAYSSGILLFKNDGTTEWFEEDEAYLRATGQDYLYYDDYTSAIAAYISASTGDTITASDVLAINYSNNSELWSAYYAMTEDMDEYYYAIAAEKEETVALKIAADGTYQELTKLPIQDETVKENIIRTVAKVAVKEADFTVFTDKEGRLTGINGTADFTLTDKRGAEHLLTAKFDLSAKAYGETKVNKFDAAEYGWLTWDEYCEKEYGEEGYTDSYEAILASLPETVRLKGITYPVMIQYTIDE